MRTMRNLAIIFQHSHLNYAPLSLMTERALFLAERAFLGRAPKMDRATLSFLREVKRVTLLATTSLDFRVILVPTLITDNAVSARSVGRGGGGVSELSILDSYG